MHKTKGSAGYAQRMHHKPIEKIHEFVSDLITDTRGQEDLKHYYMYSVQS